MSMVPVELDGEKQTPETGRDGHPRDAIRVVEEYCNFSEIVDLDDLSPASRQEYEHAEKWLRRRLGRASARAVAGQFLRWLAWAEANYRSSEGPFSVFAASGLRKLYRHHRVELGPSKVARERRDDGARRQASRQPDVWSAYLAYWNQRLERLQTAYPKRWRVPGADPVEVRDELLLLLVEALGEDELEWCEKPGREATYVFLKRAKDRLRARWKIRDVSLDTGAVLAVDRAPTPEELLIAEEREPEIKERLAAVIEALSPGLRSWLHVYLDLARDSTSPNEVTASEAARRAGVNRSTATRARQRLEVAFRKAGLQELLS